MSGKPRTGKFIECHGCKKSFYIPINRFETAKYCSRSCKDKYGCVEKIEAQCDTCGGIFSHISSRCNKAKYCSRKCYYKSLKGKGSIEYNCKNCSIKFNGAPSKKYQFCSNNCRALYEEKPRNYKHATALRKAFERRNMITHCKCCGYDKHKEILGIHHKDHNRKNNTFENLEVLCPNCHSIKHRYHIVH